MIKYLTLPLLLAGLLVADVPIVHALPSLESKKPTPTASASPAAKAEDFTITLSTKEKGPAMTAFSANDSMVVASFKGGNVAKGDKLRVDWIVESSKTMAAPNKMVYQNVQEAKGPNTYGSSSLNKPANGWPLGKYRVDVYVNNAKAASVKFTIK